MGKTTAGTTRGWALAAYVSVMLLLASVIAVVSPTTPAHAADYPGSDEVAAAQAAVSDAASTVAQLDAAVERLEKALEEADVAARIANEDHHEAQQRSVEAQRQLFAANERADDAEASLSQAKGDLATVARTGYRSGGSLGQFEALTSATGFDDVVTHTEGLNRAAVEADTTVQRVRAAELVAATMRTYAETAADEAAAAEQAAQEALDAAQEARSEAEEAVAEVEQTREEATARLASLRNVSVELERERQNGLAQERREREQQAAPPTSGGSGGSSSDGSGGTSGGSSGGSSGSSGGSSGGSTAEPDDSGDSGGNTGSDSGGSSGGWSSSASQGQAAVNHALTLMGSPYVSGGNGPGYDCSGLTSASWSAAGHDITRTSRSQYQNTTHIPLNSLSSLRKGDLIFWGSNKNPSNIYHVAIYIGNGKVAEASTHGVPAKTRTFWGGWAWGDVMPNAGRP